MNAIETRIQARKVAQEVIAEYISGEDMPFIEGFARGCEKFARETLPPPVKIEAMTEEQAIAFEQTAIKFGIHDGTKFLDVPIDYLTWLADQQRKLFDYLASERGQDRIESSDALIATRSTDG